MDDTLKELENFFRQQQTLYGPERFIQGRLSNEIPQLNIREDDEPAAIKPGNEVPPGGPLEQFNFKIKDCQECELGQSRTNFVFGVGNPNADLMFVGEAPGREEDLRGEPFVGRAGKLLDLMLHAIQIKRQDVYIANVLKCRPPKNRDPRPDEIQKCEPYLKKQIELIRPKLLVALGRISGKLLLRIDASLGDMRGTPHEYNSIPLLVTYHPAALLRSPQWKAKAWEDLKLIRRILAE